MHKAVEGISISALTKEKKTNQQRKKTNEGETVLRLIVFSSSHFVSLTANV